MVLSENKSFYLSQRLKCSCKYLTYKEWKQSQRNSKLQPFEVSTLPIRNGNWPTSRYLWSLIMDGKYLTYKEWKHSTGLGSTRIGFANPVSTLPIRNGNKKICWRPRPCSPSVSTLPIRNVHRIRNRICISDKLV